MPIVLDCPRCGKHYEVDDALAGKKSRCKQCGEVFRIAVQKVKTSEREAVREPIATPRKPAAEQQWSSILAEPNGSPKPERPSAAPREAIVAVVASKIVLNCPKCLKRYEVDSGLAGKKSRCRDCGEVFTIPVPLGRPTKKEPEWQPPPPQPPPVPSYWESALEAEAAQPAVARPIPKPVLEYEELALPPRAPSPEPSRRRSSRRDPIDSEFGVTLSGFYIAFAVLLLIVLSVWHSISDPSTERFRTVFAVAFVGLFGIGWLLSFAGGIWMLVIAFREKLEQGILCLVVPCYALYYAISRWREARGTFAMQMSFLVVTVGFLLAQIHMFHLAPTVGGMGNANWPDAAPQPGEEFAAAQGDEPVRPFGDQPAPFGNQPGPFGNQPGPFGGGGPRASSPPPRLPRHSPPPGFSIMPGRAVPFDDWVKENLAKQGDRAVAVVNIGIPLNADPTKGPTSKDVTDAIGNRLKELAPHATSSLSIGAGDRWTTFCGPVDDVRALARTIDYGTVSVKGRQIHVQLSKEYIASVPRLYNDSPVAARAPRGHDREPDPVIPAAADAITKSLIQLKSHNKQLQKEALQRLRRTTPSQRQEEVADLLIPLLDDDDTFLVDEVLQAMDTWQSPKAVPALIHRIKDDRVFVRRRAIKTLGRYKDPSTIEPIAERLKDDKHEAKDALIEMGSMVEPAMIERLRHHDRWVRSSACGIL